MVLLYIIAALCVLVPLIAGPLLAYGPGVRIARSRAVTKTAEAVGGLITVLGRPVTAVVVLFTFSAAVIVVFWPLGELAHSLENAIDWPVWSWVTDRTDPSFESFNWFYTALGDRDPLKWVTVIGALVFAALWRRRFWIPLVAIPLSFVLEQYVQAIISGMVSRGHPPTGLGTYPSGGIARIVMIIGALALFAGLTWRLGKRFYVALGTAVLTMAVYEGYSRIYVEKHWLTDVLTGIMFGPALFLGFALFVAVLAGTYPGRRRAEPVTAQPSAELEPAQ